MRALRHFALALPLAGCLAGCAPGSVSGSAVATTPSPAPTPRSSAPRLTLAQFVDSMVDAPQFRSAHWGVLVVDPGRGETLYARNADKLFVPASNMKLVTGMTALAQLGADFQWTTT